MEGCRAKITSSFPHDIEADYGTLDNHLSGLEVTIEYMHTFGLEAGSLLMSGGFFLANFCILWLLSADCSAQYVSSHNWRSSGLDIAPWESLRLYRRLLSHRDDIR